ncbi:MAG TPA: mechanosensitive ion channel family protein, partial [Phycisphaerae bacterium]
MLLWLAQTDSAPGSAPAIPLWDIELWTPTSGDLLHAFLTFSVTILIGIFFFGMLRRPIQRMRLTPAFAIAISALAIFLGTWGLKPGHHNVTARIFDSADPIAYWLTRILAAAWVYALLRFLDRTLIVTLLTRGGKVAIPRFFHQMVNIVLSLFAILIFGSIAFGWDIDRFLAGSAVVSIVLGLALQESLGNFFSGLVMQA